VFGFVVDGSGGLGDVVGSEDLQRADGEVAEGGHGAGCGAGVDLGCSPDPLILVRSPDSRAAVLHASRCRATSREGTAAGEESRR
jgi:hypothetical protein